jgi:putative transposase
LELVRYIHLNPLRAGIVNDLKSIDMYRYCGHAVNLNKRKHTWQDTEYVCKRGFIGPQALSRIR